MIDPIKFPQKKFDPENVDGEKKSKLSPSEKTDFDGKRNFEQIYEKERKRGQTQEGKVSTKDLTEKPQPFVEKKRETPYSPATQPTEKRKEPSPSFPSRTDTKTADQPASKANFNVQSKDVEKAIQKDAFQKKENKRETPTPIQPKPSQQTSTPHPHLPTERNFSAQSKDKDKIDAISSPKEKKVDTSYEIKEDKTTPSAFKKEADKPAAPFSWERKYKYQKTETTGPSFQKQEKPEDAFPKEKIDAKEKFERTSQENMKVTPQTTSPPDKSKSLPDLAEKKGLAKDEDVIGKFQDKLSTEKSKLIGKENQEITDKKKPPVIEEKVKKEEVKAQVQDKDQPGLKPIKQELSEEQQKSKAQESPFSLFGQSTVKTTSAKERKAELPPASAAETLSQSELFPGLPKEKITEKESTDKITTRFENEQHDLSSVNPVISPTTPISQAATTETEKVKPSITPQEVKEIVDRIAKELYTLTQAGRTDTVIILQHPPMLNKVQVVITQFDSAANQLNLSFENLTASAKNLLDSQMEGLKKALADEGIKTQMITTTTEVITVMPNIEPKAHQEEGRGEREERGGQQGDREQQQDEREQE